MELHVNNKSVCCRTMLHKNLAKKNNGSYLFYVDVAIFVVCSVTAIIVCHKLLYIIVLIHL